MPSTKYSSESETDTGFVWITWLHGWAGVETRPGCHLVLDPVIEVVFNSEEDQALCDRVNLGHGALSMIVVKECEG